jgi:3-carboxy-cis,cis-muconate cycloisomerase
MDELFGAARVTGAMLRFEAALALGLGDAGVAPRDEVEAVAEACAPIEDPEALLATTWENGTPLLALTGMIKSRLGSDEERRWVHHGATTQDAIDTAHALLSREALDILDGGLVAVASAMMPLVEEHRDRAQMARTFLQDARPTTFGSRVAGWLHPLIGQIEALRRSRTGLTLQLGGPVGDLSDYGPAGSAVVKAVAARLNLAAPSISWHTDRSRVATLVNAVTAPVGTLAKMAMDVTLLAQSSIGEITTRPGGSSSMPHKQNPIDAVRLLAAADICRGAATMITGARPHELDRALGSWHVEWVALPTVFQTAAAAIEAADSLLGSIEVDAHAMSLHADAGVPDIDPALIDSVLDDYSRVMGPG